MSGRERGSFTGSFDWVAEAPARCELTFQQMCDLMRLALDGEAVPHYSDAQDLLSDLALVGANEIRHWQRRYETEAASGAYARGATARAWTTVWNAGKRLTIRTADLRAALEQTS